MTQPPHSHSNLLMTGRQFPMALSSTQWIQLSEARIMSQDSGKDAQEQVSDDNKNKEYEVYESHYQLASVYFQQTSLVYCAAHMEQCFILLLNHNNLDVQAMPQNDGLDECGEYDEKEEEEAEDLDTIEFPKVVYNYATFLTQLYNVIALSSLQQLQSQGNVHQLRPTTTASDKVQKIRSPAVISPLTTKQLPLAQATPKELAFDVLTKAKIISERFRLSEALISTYNNFAVYYRSIGKTQVALSFACRALMENSNYGEHSIDVNVAEVHLNISSLCCELKQMDVGLMHARCAQKMLLVNLFGNHVPISRALKNLIEKNENQRNSEIINEDSNKQIEEHKESKSEDDSASPAEIQLLYLLSISYHSEGTILCHQGKWGIGNKTFSKANAVISTYLSKLIELSSSHQLLYVNIQEQLRISAEHMKHQDKPATRQSKEINGTRGNSPVKKSKRPSNESTKVLTSRSVLYANAVQKAMTKSFQELQANEFMAQSTDEPTEN